MKPCIIITFWGLTRIDTWSDWFCWDCGLGKGAWGLWEGIELEELPPPKAFIGLMAKNTGLPFSLGNCVDLTYKIFFAVLALWNKDLGIVSVIWELLRNLIGWYRPSGVRSTSSTIGRLPFCQKNTPHYIHYNIEMEIKIITILSTLEFLIIH